MLRVQRQSCSAQLCSLRFELGRGRPQWADNDEHCDGGGAMQDDGLLLEHET